MAFLPVKFLWVFLLDPDEEKAFTIEENITTVKAVFDPVIRMHNVSNGDLDLKVVYILELGFGDDPLISGSHTYTIVDETIPSGALRDVPLTNLDNLQDIKTSHTVTVKNPSTTEQRKVKLLVFGKSEVSVKLSADQEVITSTQTL